MKIALSFRKWSLGRLLIFSINLCSNVNILQRTKNAIYFSNITKRSCLMKAQRREQDVSIFVAPGLFAKVTLNYRMWLKTQLRGFSCCYSKCVNSQCLNFGVKKSLILSPQQQEKTPQSCFSHFLQSREWFFLLTLEGINWIRWRSSKVQPIQNSHGIATVRYFSQVIRLNL